MSRDLAAAHREGVVFASAVSPFLLQGSDNPEGPLTQEQTASMTADLTKDEAAAVPHAQTFIIKGGPHGVDVSHADEWNQALLDFLAV